MNALIIPIETQVIRRGAAAWSWLKDNAKMSREKWREVGEALLVGRKLYPGKQNDRAFGQWCKDQGFSGLCRHEKADAMWLADNWKACEAHTPPGAGNPSWIRRAFNEAQKAPPTSTSNLPTMNEEDAEFLLKIVARTASEFVGEAAVANSKLDSWADFYGVTREELVEKAREIRPVDHLTDAEKELNALREELSRRDKILDEMKARFSSATKDELIEMIAEWKATGKLKD